jgi:hypothetical protein
MGRGFVVVSHSGCGSFESSLSYRCKARRTRINDVSAAALQPVDAESQGRMAGG